MNWFKETYLLAKWMFCSNTKKQSELELVQFKYYPFTGYSAMCWFGHLIYKKKEPSEVTINHENIHLQQAKDCGSWYAYYIKYLWEWILGNPFYKSAYYTNPFEMESYGNESDLEYLLKRKSEWLSAYKFKNRRVLWNLYDANSFQWKMFCITTAKNIS